MPALWEIHSVILNIWRIAAIEDLPPSRLKLLEILNDAPMNRRLQIELAITVDAGEQFVKATYRLEGDGPLVFSAYEEIAALRVGISNEHYPNMNSVAAKLSSNDSQKQHLLAYGKGCVKPASDYFYRKFDKDLKVAVSIFKCARYFDPGKFVELKPSCSDIDDLRVIPDLNSDVVLGGLKSELPKYMASADGVSMQLDKLLWWQNHASELPCWSNACRSVLVIQPSSAAAERVFSLLSNNFSDRQTRCLEDYIETSLMLQYN